MSASTAIFRTLNADDPDPETTTIESLCINCEENGITRMLLTKIPFYKDVILMSFECEHCGYKNNEIQSGGRIEEKGIRIVFKIQTAKDLNRTVVKSDYTSITIPELVFEIPAGSQKGEVTTVEGILDRAVAGLKQDQESRAKDHPDVASQIEKFAEKLSKLKELEIPFTLIIEDISGNCFLSNPHAPAKDPSAEVTVFVRTKDQDHTLGIYTKDEIEENSAILKPPEEKLTYESLQSEVFTLPSNCSQCNAPCEVKTKLTAIPYFKEVLIMAANCDVCGYRTNEIKSGTGIEPKGVRFEVSVSSTEDLSRDILKSDTCKVMVPELELEVGPATLGGRFTTVEGLLTSVREQLGSQEAITSDSAEECSKMNFDSFLKKLDAAIACDIPFTLILDDPAGNSFVQSKTPPEPDKQLKVSHYERTFDQNEDLGLNDMVVENY